MKHPTPEAWMAYLYNDHSVAPEATRAEAEAHLLVCGECREQLERWRATLATLDEDLVPELSQPIALPPPPLRFHSLRAVWPWALAAGVMFAAAFLGGRAMGPSRSEWREELAKARTEWARELTVELRNGQQQDLADIATATVKATAAGQRTWATTLAAEIQETRLADRREFLAALNRLDRQRSEEISQLRDGFQTLVKKTGGAFQETDTRLNALASALPVGNQVDAP